MKCTNCGYETQPGARFCVQCGTTLPAEPATTASPAAA
ncbi:MAG: zinc-ribbon domain-containing protein, partial [Casimicrobiaceae bacterium]